VLPSTLLGHTIHICPVLDPQLHLTSFIKNSTPSETQLRSNVNCRLLVQRLGLIEYSYVPSSQIRVTRNQFWKSEPHFRRSEKTGVRVLNMISLICVGERGFSARHRIHEAEGGNTMSTKPMQSIEKEANRKDRKKYEEYEVVLCSFWAPRSLPKRWSLHDLTVILELTGPWVYIRRVLQSILPGDRNPCSTYLTSSGFVTYDLTFKEIKIVPTQKQDCRPIYEPTYLEAHQSLPSQHPTLHEKMSRKFSSYIKVRETSFSDM
jgi:hypothetical protein